jgi:sodium-dependent phosphate cotransporter
MGHTIKTSPLIQNPVSASILGMMITLVLQNGSTLVSILVGMIASGLISVHQAIPFLIGSEIGASLTNALISLAQSGDCAMFRRSFAAASMNDAYNILNYLVLLPFEISFGFIEKLSAIMVQPLVGTKAKELKTLNLLTDPLLNQIVHVSWMKLAYFFETHTIYLMLIFKIDDDAINAAIAAGHNYSVPSGRDTFIYRCIDMDTKEIDTDCQFDHLFAYSMLPDTVIGSILLGISICSLICCLVGIVKTLQSLLAGRVAVITRKLLDQEFPAPFQCLTGYLIMLVGCLIVMVVQSNTVIRSAMTPLV